MVLVFQQIEKANIFYFNDGVRPIEYLHDLLLTPRNHIKLMEILLCVSKMRGWKKPYKYILSSRSEFS